MYTYYTDRDFLFGLKIIFFSNKYIIIKHCFFSTRQCSSNIWEKKERNQKNSVLAPTDLVIKCTQDGFTRLLYSTQKKKKK